MYFADRGPLPFHESYAGDEAVVGIDSLAVLHGRFAAAGSESRHRLGGSTPGRASGRMGTGKPFFAAWENSTVGVTARDAMGASLMDVLEWQGPYANSQPKAEFVLRVGAHWPRAHS